MAESSLHYPASDEKLLQGILYFVYHRMSESIRYYLGDDKRRPERYQLHAFNYALYTGFSYKLFGRSSAYGVILLVLGVALSLITNHLFREDKDLAM